MKRSPQRGEVRPYEPVVAAESHPAAARIEMADTLWARWTRFWFTPGDPIGFHVLRVLAGLLFLAWLLPIAGSLDGLFSLDGWFDLQAYREASRLPDGAPKPMTWSLLYVFSAGWKLQAAYWVSIGVLVAFTLGLATRITAVLTWLIVASFTASPILDADVDPLLILLSFYLMIGYLLIGQRGGDLTTAQRILGVAPGWLRRWLGRPAVETPSVGATLAVRLLQIHMALLITTNGLHKLQFGDWWSGIALWYPLYSAPEVTLDQVRRLAPYAEGYVSFLNVLCYGAILWQITFTLFAWAPRWRLLLVGGALVGWLVNLLIYQMPLFGAAIAVGCASFVTEWRWLGARLLEQWGRLFPADRQKVADSIPVASGQN